MINVTTGFLFGSKISVLAILMTIFAFVFGVIILLFGDKFGKYVGIGYLLVTAMVAIAIGAIAWSSETLVADIYFIPVNHPEAEDVSWSLMVVALVFYALSFVSGLVSCFGSKLVKTAE